LEASEFANGGRECQPKVSPVRVKVHDFPSDAAGKAIPYVIDDLGADTSWAAVGTDHDPATFAGQTLRRWWLATGSSCYQAARQLICADSGGSNGYRLRAWKMELTAWPPRSA
jgi:hypothetical protein